MTDHWWVIVLGFGIGKLMLALDHRERYGKWPGE
jgi:hypothetical protein